MEESVSEYLKVIGVSLFCFISILCWAKFVITDTCRRIARDSHGNSNDHVIITIKESIPVVDFNSQDFKECVVCLAELADGDKAKVLPSCNHCFHADCIDSWFRSHSTCPICRNTVGSTPELADEGLTQNPDIPTSSEHLGSPTEACG